MWLHRYQAEGRLFIAFRRSHQFTELFRTNPNHRAVQLLEDAREYLLSTKLTLHFDVIVSFAAHEFDDFFKRFDDSMFHQ